MANFIKVKDGRYVNLDHVTTVSVSIGTGILLMWGIDQELLGKIEENQWLKFLDLEFIDDLSKVTLRRKFNLPMD